MQSTLLKEIFRASTRVGSGNNDAASQLESLFPVAGAGGNERGALATPSAAFATLLGPSTGTTNRAADLNPQSNSLGAGSQVVDAFSELTKNLDQLRAVSEAHTSVVSVNTQALTTNTASKVASQALASVGKAAGGLFGGLTALPIVSGLIKLFGGGGSTAPQQPLEKYVPPAPVRFDAVLGNRSGTQTLESASYDQYGYARSAAQGAPEVPSYSSLLAGALNTPSTTARDQAGGSGQAGSGSGQSVDGTGAGRPTTQVTVNVQAMDSRSFLDRSHDIAQAVREAMLNMHSINDVVNDL